MHASAAVGWLLAALTGLTGLYCLMRLRRPGTPRAQRRLDASEALKGLGMAAMAIPYGSARVVPVPVWVVLFGGAAAWSLVEGLRPGGHRGHHLYHAVGHLAMVYMALAMAGATAGAGAGTTAGAGTMAGMAAPSGVPLLTGVLLVFFGCYVVVGGVRLVGAAPSGATAVPGGGTGGGSVVRRLLGAPELPDACRMVLGMGMFAMLLSM
ncbi:DUF5134 domain-containing protein [Streptacidiphilus albus]|uniref:DUF5134 domain-containing protein n=1 Tax=Streptacidiphilus albus TaxID=105425 RepID=UPI00054BB722|nr:DUF5134 domain-containing protein [Streptacidiphilus albus]